MYSFIITVGDRIIQAWQTEWDSYVKDLDDKTRVTHRITDEEYKKIIKRLPEFTYQDGKLKEKSIFDINLIAQSQENHLEKRVDELEKEVEKLKKVPKSPT